MSITATLAGPVFNTLIGLSLSNFASFAGNGRWENEKVRAGFFHSELEFYYRILLFIEDRPTPEEKYGGFDLNSVLPMIIIGS